MPGKRHRLAALAVVILAIVVRLLFLADSGDDPSAVHPLVDSRTYHERAVELAEDGILDERFLWQAPLYPLFLAAIYQLLGVSLTAVKLLQILLAGGTCLLTITLGRQLFDQKTGLLAGVLVALCGPLLFFDLQLLATGLAVFWMMALGNLALQVGQKKDRVSLVSALGLGMVGALALLTRSTFLPLVVFLLILISRRPLGLKKLALGAAGLMIILVPFSLTMQNFTGHSGLLPSSGAINLFIGNNPNFEETIGIRIGLPWEDLITQPLRHGYEPGPWAGQQYFRTQVRNFITQQPGKFLGLLVRKTTHLFSGRELPRNLDMYGHRQFSGVLSVLVFKVGPWGFPMALLWPLAALGLVVARKQSPAYLLGMLMVYAAALVLVFVASRYRAPMIPLLCILAAHGLLWMWARIRSHQWRTLTPAWALLLGMTMLATVPGPFAQEKSNMQGELYYGAGWNHYQAGEWSAAEREFRQAILWDEGLPEAHNFLALVLVKNELWDEAMKHFEVAALLNPNYSDAVKNLELCRAKRAEALYRRGRALEGDDFAQARRVYEEIREFHPQWPEVSVRLAWMLCTADDPLERDGARALQLLAQLRPSSVLKDPYVLYVKAVALAEAGQFEDALEVASKARGMIDATVRSDLAGQLDKALVLFGTGKTLKGGLPPQKSSH